MWKMKKTTLKNLNIIKKWEGILQSTYFILSFDIFIFSIQIIFPEFCFQC